MQPSEFVPYLGPIVALLSVLIGAGALYHTWNEYKRKLARERMTLLLGFKHRFADDNEFREILLALEDEPPTIAAVPYQKRRRFAGFIEELALAQQAGLLNADHVDRSFRYYIRLMFDSDAFWADLTPHHQGWLTLRELAKADGIQWPRP